MPTFETVTDTVVYGNGDPVPAKDCTSIDIYCIGATALAVTECATADGTYTDVPADLLKDNRDASGNGGVGYMGYSEYIKATDASGTVVVVKRGCLHAPTANVD